MMHWDYIKSDDLEQVKECANNLLKEGWEFIQDLIYADGHWVLPMVYCDPDTEV